jgi:hypothetical protein
MSKQDELLAWLRRKVAAKVPPHLVERQMIRVLAVAIDDALQREARLRAIIKFLLAERRADDRDGPPVRRMH